MCKSPSIFIKMAQACLSSCCMWWHAFQPRWKCPVHLLEKLNNLFVAQLILDPCTLLILCTAQLSLKAAVLHASNSFAWHPPGFHDIVLCFQNKQNEESILRMFGRNIMTLLITGTIQQPSCKGWFHLATTKVRTQRKTVAHDVTVLWGVRLNCPIGC